MPKKSSKTHRLETDDYVRGKKTGGVRLICYYDGEWVGYYDQYGKGGCYATSFRTWMADEDANATAEEIAAIAESEQRVEDRVAAALKRSKAAMDAVLNKADPELRGRDVDALNFDPEQQKLFRAMVDASFNA